MTEPFFCVRVRAKVEDVEAVVARCREAGERFGVFVQAADEGAVYDAAHAESAWRHAQRATGAGSAGSRSLGGEFLRYLTCQRQAGKAIEQGGVKPGAEAIVLVAQGQKAGAAVFWIMDKIGGSKDPAGLRPQPGVLDALGITQVQRDTVTHDRVGELVLERVALMDLDRK